jgi:hypothetical protein
MILETRVIPISYNENSLIVSHYIRPKGSDGEWVHIGTVEHSIYEDIDLLDGEIC